MTATDPSYSPRRRRPIAAIALTALLTAILLPCCLVFGSVEIPPAEVLRTLVGAQDNDVWRIIILDARLPMALTALLAGASLSIAGLLMQTTFDNPLAGPSILGVSTGSSLGVAVVLLALGGSVAEGAGVYVSTITGALLGAGAVIALLLLFSRLVKSTAMLLIVGIMTGYLASSAISLLNFFSTQEGVHSFVIWGMGNFTGVTLGRLSVLAPIAVALILASMLMIKPLDAMLLGARYAESLGVNVRLTRNLLLLLSGALTAIITAFCGPIGFIGLVVPHIARLCTATSAHRYLLPATALCGAALALICALISVIPGSTGVIPVNAITPVIGVPVIIYIIVNRGKLHYFN